MSDENLDKLQWAKNMFTCVITDCVSRDHITPTLNGKTLNTDLSKEPGITFKVMTLVYQLLLTRQPSYLAEHISDKRAMENIMIKIEETTD